MSDDVHIRGLLETYMQANGLKSTRQRQIIFDTFLSKQGHLSIEELLAHVQLEMPGVGYATVYRTMKLLVDAKVACEHRFGDSHAVYERANSDEHHDHIICVGCGHIYEFEDELIEARQTQIAEEYGVRIVSHRHEIFGECLDSVRCAQNREALENR